MTVPPPVFPHSSQSYYSSYPTFKCEPLPSLYPQQQWTIESNTSSNSSSPTQQTSSRGKRAKQDTKEYKKEWYAAHREAQKQKMKAWYEKNKAKRLLQMKAYNSRRLQMQREAATKNTPSKASLSFILC
ncbi:hypothetical protein THRCLA_20276 [Thraustotheca clavata]|uniref:Uncharacterized protein n=1 Tax=Thraustotheca clavata TaxID=74557 RepID=A0A1W0A9J2_9STRA|nr:hypothetical protein THRCLA_20276 [Thraustotheca clavata]